MHDPLKALAMLNTPGPWLVDALIDLGYPKPVDLPDLVTRLEPVEEGSRRWKIRRKSRQKAHRHLSRFLFNKLYLFRLRDQEREVLGEEEPEED